LATGEKKAMSGNGRNNFFDELKRRNVLRVGAAYLVGAWLIIQIADTVFPYIGVSDRTITFLIVLLAIGFLPALVVAWFFELTPDGLVRDEETSRSESSVSRAGMRTLDYIVIAALIIIVTVYAFDRFSAPPPAVARFTGEASIAVLPFENRSANPDDAYFVDGIHGDILMSLTNIDALRVISRTSVERFADHDRSIPEIGAELGVAAVLEGGVQRVGDTIRVSVQLVETATDRNLWAENYDRPLTADNVFAIQSEISAAIAAELQAALSPDDKRRLNTVPTSDLDAYEAYLLGNQRIQRRSSKSLDEAIEYFEEAVELDPQFAQAWVGIADSYLLLRTYSGRDRDELLEPALSAVTTALALNPDIGEAYATLGAIHSEFRTGSDPETFFRRAIDTSPSYAPARQWYGEYLLRQRRNDEALVQLQEARKLDPLSAIINAELGEFYLDAGRLADAKERIVRAIEIDPQLARGYAELAVYFRRIGEWAKALVAAETADRMNPGQVANLAARASALMQLGDMATVERILEEANSIAPNHPFVRNVTVEMHVLRSDDAAVRYAVDNWGVMQIQGYNIALRANDYLRKDMAEEAVALIESLDGPYALPASPDPSAVRHRGVVLLTMGYAGALRAAGREQDAQAWIATLQPYFDDEPRLDTSDLNLTQDDLAYLVDRSKFHVLNRDDESALNSLRRAVDAGWSDFWIYVFEHDPILAAIRDREEFQAMATEVRARMAEELEDYRAGNVVVL
jgi:TolB-like protein/Tfp pilus assembly protein PilF